MICSVVYRFRAIPFSPQSRFDAALLEMAQDFRGSLFSEKLSADLTEKITIRILNREGAAKPADLSAAEIRRLRERANMSQAVFARFLNVTTGYVSQLERGAKRPTGPALALLNVIKRKGIQAIL
jgi:putative transcriptional regulator